ncbi:SAE2-domain-containing protein [Durotheca rogersii]|uniref:SAE2-domain-containing protein n=1 Tax=Durotheca rogersii TaxID=419775 RepID=UPI0022207327|nr:SAE2-domain-containing protein [Durotheca rogersii]KAI5857318.1 SAE2-domain-containing protein [Durotheca rogersii]
MEDWFEQVGRRALFDALGRACDQINNELGNGFKSHREEAERLAVELESLRSRVSAVHQLEEENRSLKRELQNLKDLPIKNALIRDSEPHDVARNPRTPLVPRSVNQVSSSMASIKAKGPNVDKLTFSELKQEYERLDESYAKVRGKFAELENANTELTQLLRKRTKAYNQWKEHATILRGYYERRSRKIKKLEAQIAAATETTSPSRLDAGVSSSMPVESMTRPQGGTPGVTEPDIPQESRMAGQGSISGEDTPGSLHASTGDGDRESSAGVASPLPIEVDQRVGACGRRGIMAGVEHLIGTEERDAPSLPPLPGKPQEAWNEAPIKGEPSSDAPVIVSERCLRKRNRGDDQTEDTRASTKIKVEDGSSPLPTAGRYCVVPRDSIDFDTDGGRVETPRKPNKVNCRSKDAPPFLSQTDTPQSQADRSDLTSTEARLMRGVARVPSSPAPPRGLIDEDSGGHLIGECEVTGSLKRRDAQPSTSTLLDRNPRAQPTLETNSITKQRASSSRWASLASLPEDGDQYQGPRTYTKKTSKSGRLQRLLNGLPSGHDVASPLPSAQRGRGPPSTPFKFSAPQRRELPFGRDGSKKDIHSRSAEAAPNSRESPKVINTKRAPDPKETVGTLGCTPLRARPISQLSVGDFKINPHSNEGYDYAFTDVVRNKDERASLSGCIKESCCGQTFRLQARVERDKASPSEFQVLLEAYLGDEAWKLSTMTRPEKESLWLEAKAQALADEHGKHRHRFQRAPSPEGFWRTDFPNTQEQLRDKEGAARMAQQIVEERYREAMRPGGRWMFRDE